MMGKQGIFWLRQLALFGLSICLLLILYVPLIARAQSGEGFSLQVSPSPLVATVRPGEDTTLDLQIRNTNSSPQSLKMGLRSFSMDDATGQVNLGTTAPTNIQDLVSFKTPSFNLQAGEIMTQQVTIHTPASAGFSYYFAITIAQQNPPKAAKGQSAIVGSVAIFTLINVDKPGANRKFDLTSVSLSKHTYEYLPASITLKIKNTGNTLVQPQGTVYLQRHSSDATPLAALSLNQNSGYILPGSSRSFTVSWNDGYPHYEAVSSTSDKQKLVWRGNALSKLRIGRYVAKVVAVYNDGGRDVPITAEVSFWVIPWKLLLGALFIVLLLVVGSVAMVRSFSKAVKNTSRKVKKRRKSTPPYHEEE